MKVKLTTDYNTPFAGASAGETIDLPVDEAKALVKAGGAKAPGKANEPEKKPSDETEQAEAEGKAAKK